MLLDNIGASEWIPSADAPPHALSATEVGAVLGLNPFCSRFAVFKRKTSGRRRASKAPARAARGTRLERLVLERYAEAVDVAAGVGLRSNGLLGAQPDGIRLDDGGIVEVKVVDTRRHDEPVPEYYLPQIHTLMAVFPAAPYVDVVQAQFRPDDTLAAHTVFRVPRDDGWLAARAGTLERFCQQVDETNRSVIDVL
jgi:hypothetical protein